MNSELIVVIVGAVLATAGLLALFAAII